jgi:hypothetical protein
VTTPKRKSRVKRLLACLLVVTAAIPAAADMAMAHDDACQDVAVYLTLVDESINEGIAALNGEPGFRDAFASGIETSEANDAGFLALSPEEQEALIAYLRMPKEALAGINVENIPDEVGDLHDSAVEYWTLLPDMMQTIANESPSAAIPFYEDLDTATGENVVAQKTLDATCPNEVTVWEDAYDRLQVPNPGTPEADLVIVWDRHGDDEAEGLGYPFLFFASGDADAMPAALARACEHSMG